MTQVLSLILSRGGGLSFEGVQAPQRLARHTRRCPYLYGMKLGVLEGSREKALQGSEKSELLGILGRVGQCIERPHRML